MSIMDYYADTAERMGNRRSSSQQSNAAIGRVEGLHNAINRRNELPDTSRGHGGRAPFYSQEAGQFQRRTASMMDQYLQRGVHNRRAPNSDMNPNSVTTNRRAPNDYEQPESPSINTLRNALTDIISRRSADRDTGREATPIVSSRMVSALRPRVTRDGFVIPDSPLYSEVTRDMTREQIQESVRQRFLQLWTGGG